MKISLLFLGLCAMTSVARSAPAPAYTTVHEFFFHSATYAELSRLGQPETIRRVGNSSNPLSSWFAWGGRNASTFEAVAIDNTVATSFENPCSGVIFLQRANVAGSFAYTRFDNTSTNLTVGAAVPSVVVNASEPDSKLRIVIYSSGYTLPQTELLAVMIRDNANWWISNGQRVPRVDDAVGPAQALDYEFHGDNAVTWTQVSGASGGGADMDQVDNGGQSALDFLSAGTPNFGAIEGMGLYVLEGPGSGYLGITDMILIGAQPVTAVRDWEVR